MILNNSNHTPRHSASSDKNKKKPERGSDVRAKHAADVKPVKAVKAAKVKAGVKHAADTVSVRDGVVRGTSTVSRDRQSEAGTVSAQDTVARRKRRSGVDIAIRVVCAISLLFLILQIGRAYISGTNGDDLAVEPALPYTTPESVLFKGVYIRNERILNFPYSGTIVYEQENGSKLRHGAVVARVYDNVDDIARQVRAKESKEQLAALDDAYRFIGTDTSQIENFRIQLNDKQAEILQAVRTDDYGSLARLKNDYIGLQGKLNVVQYGSSDSFDLKRAELRAEIASLENGNINSHGEARALTVPENFSGYFVGFSDGYEDELNFDTAAALSEADIDRIIRKPDIAAGNRAVGKVVETYKWRLVAVLNDIGVEALSIGASMSLIIGQDNENAQAKIIDAVRIDDFKTLVTFECDNLTKNAYIKRADQFRLILNSFSGIRVDKKALRFDENGVAGVYAAEGNVVVFKKVIVDLSQATYVIVKDTTGEPGYLELYDSIITGGKDLYNGKQLDSVQR